MLEGRKRKLKANPIPESPKYDNNIKHGWMERLMTVIVELYYIAEKKGDVRAPL